MSPIIPEGLSAKSAIYQFRCRYVYIILILLSSVVAVGLLNHLIVTNASLWISSLWALIVTYFLMSLIECLSYHIILDNNVITEFLLGRQISQITVSSALHLRPASAWPVIGIASSGIRTWKTIALWGPSNEMKLSPLPWWAFTILANRKRFISSGGDSDSTVWMPLLPVDSKRMEEAIKSIVAIVD